MTLKRNYKSVRFRILLDLMQLQGHNDEIFRQLFLLRMPGNKKLANKGEK